MWSGRQQPLSGPMPDEELEGLVRFALGCRRRVKDQKKKCLKIELSDDKDSKVSSDAQDTLIKAMVE